MNKGQKVLTAVVALLAVEVLPMSVLSVRALTDGVEITYETDDDKTFDKFEADTLRAMRQAEKDMKEGE